jgi:hypothetical protein
VARALAELPKISKSFSEGRISYSKVRAMTRVATARNEMFEEQRNDPADVSADKHVRGNVESIRMANQRNGLEITAATLPSLWRGERMDQDLAQLGMMSLD